MNKLLIKFQEKVNTVVESNCLNFMAEVWDIKDEENFINKRLMIIEDTYFPYLDKEMNWHQREELKFWIHMKPNQKLKYLNGDINHLPSTFRTTPYDMLHRFNKPTSKSKKLEKVIIDKIYPHHSKSPKVAGTAPNKFPTSLKLETIRN